MMNHKTTPTDPTMLDAYYAMAEGCCLPTLPLSIIWREAPRKPERKAARRSH